jgi:hypothetical protein
MVTATEFTRIIFTQVDIAKFNKSRTRWAGKVVCMGDVKTNGFFMCGNQKDIDHYEDPDVDGSIILKYILKK